MALNRYSRFAKQCSWGPLGAQGPLGALGPPGASSHGPYWPAIGPLYTLPIHRFSGYYLKRREEADVGENADWTVLDMKTMP